MIDHAKWKPEPDGTAEDHWIDLTTKQEETYRDHMTASVKWDGCIHLNIYEYTDRIGKGEVEEHVYLHICDLDGLIKTLENLREAAKSHFGEGWP